MGKLALSTGDLEKGGDPKPSLLVSDTESALSVGKQMELEANNAIKYRTCSWPKVNPSHLRILSISDPVAGSGARRS